MPDVWRFSLPEEFLLLSQHPYGGLPDPYKTAAGCAAAELGELALHRRLQVNPENKYKLLGFEFHSPPGRIHLLDLTPTGLAWADELLEELGHLTASQGDEIHLHAWLQARRHKSLFLHTEALTKSSGPFPTLKNKTRYPHSDVCDVLITWLKGVADGLIPMDERMLLLSDLTEGARLNHRLGTTLTFFLRIERARGSGQVGALPEYLRDSSTMLSAIIESFDTFKYYDRRLGGTVGGGDSDGGGGE